jgi:hypothetical protein
MSCILVERKQIINTFVYEIGRDEKDLGKREKIDNLQLDAAEWDELKLFNDLLAVSSILTMLLLLLSVQGV